MALKNLLKSQEQKNKESNGNYVKMELMPTPQVGQTVLFRFLDDIFEDPDRELEDGTVVEMENLVHWDEDIKRLVKCNKTLNSKKYMNEKTSKEEEKWFMNGQCIYCNLQRHEKLIYGKEQKAPPHAVKYQSWPRVEWQEKDPENPKKTTLKQGVWKMSLNDLIFGTGKGFFKFFDAVLRGDEDFTEDGKSLKDFWWKLGENRTVMKGKELKSAERQNDETLLQNIVLVAPTDYDDAVAMRVAKKLTCPDSPPPKPKAEGEVPNQPAAPEVTEPEEPESESEDFPF